LYQHIRQKEHDQSVQIRQTETSSPGAFFSAAKGFIALRWRRRQPAERSRSFAG